MSKSAIVTLSIASLLSIASITDARSIEHQSQSQSKSYLIAKKSNSTELIPDRNNWIELESKPARIKMGFVLKNWALLNSATPKID